MRASSLSAARVDSADELSVVPAGTPPSDATPLTGQTQSMVSPTQDVRALDTVPRAPGAERIEFGTVLGGRYEVREHLGSGGMGTVYAARDLLLEVPVALKFVRPQLASNPREQSRLRREVRLAQAITHVNVIRTFTLEHEDGHLFIVMELLDGCSVAERLRQGPLPLPEALRVTRDVLAGLAAAHAKNIVHRDIKPQNTKICADGRVVVMDFGIARASQADPLPGGPGPVEVPVVHGPHTVLAGTPGYMAPEVLAGAPATALADLYAVGVLLHQMTSGRIPSDARTMSVQADTSDEVVIPTDPRDLTGAPPRLTAVLERLLASDPAQRFQSVAEVMRALDGLEASEEPVPAAVPVEATSPVAALPAPSRRVWPWIGGAAALAGVAASVAVAVQPGAPRRSPTAPPATALPAPPPAPVAIPDPAPAAPAIAAPAVTPTIEPTSTAATPAADASAEPPLATTKTGRRRASDAARRAPARAIPNAAVPAAPVDAAQPDDPATRRRKLLDLDED